MAITKWIRTITSLALVSLCSTLLSAAGPGTIQAEAFSNMLGVATEACSDSGGGLDVGWIEKGDWMVYPITISTSGAYTISYRVATPNSGVVLAADLNANAIPLGSVSLPNTGGWQTWTTVTQNVTLNAGSYNFGINAGTGGFNLNWFSIDAASPGVTDNTPFFMIVNKFSGKALDLIGGDTANGARINQWTPDVNGPNQRWAILPTEGNAHFKLVSWVSGKCACIDADSTASGAQLHSWDYVGNDPGQQFDLVDAGNGWFKIRNVKSGKILDDNAWGTGNDNKIQQWDDYNTDNQIWRLQPWGDYFIRAASGRYICVQGMGNNDGSRIIQYDQENNPWFKWRFTSEGDGWYGCFSLNAPSKVLCVNGASTQPGSYCHLWEYSAANIGDQKLRIMPQTDGTFKFYFQFDGQTWDIPGGQTGNNVELDQYPENGNAWQKFKLERVMGGGGTTTKSAKRGIAYDLLTAADFTALKSGVSWWYNWAVGTGAPAGATSTYGLEYIPMSWNGNNIASGGQVDTYLSAHPECKYLLVMNEPNFLDQANKNIAEVVALWPQIEAMAQKHGVKIVGPALNWGTVNTAANPSDPIVWLDGFFAQYRANYGKEAQLDAIAFHWYDYGLVGGGTGFLDSPSKLPKYGKKVWVTEFANWHTTNDGAQMDTIAKEKEQMRQWVSFMETHDIVERYSWFTGRQPGNPCFTSLFQNYGLGAAQGDGVLSELGQYYISLPVGQ